MSYIEDYTYYNSGNECPQSYHLWSALSMLGAIAGPKIYFDRGYFIVYPNLYVGLVGPAGIGKDTAKDIVRDIVEEHFPNYPVSQSIQSHQDISSLMAADEGIRVWRDSNGILHDFRPFYCIISELRNFLSVDLVNMTNFLIEMYSAKRFGTGFKKDRAIQANQKFNGPYFSVLACVQPDWLMENLRFNLITGGLGRRLILVTEWEKKLIAEPSIPKGGQEAMQRVLEHLQALHDDKVHGNFVMSPEAREWWIKWYENPARLKTEDPILREFYSTKHVNILKVAMLLALSNRPFRLVYETIHLKTALAMLDLLEPKVNRLTGGIGRNEIAAVAEQMMQSIEASDGAIAKKKLYGSFFRNLRTNEFEEVLHYLIQTDRIGLYKLKVDGIDREYVLTPARYHDFVEQQKKQKLTS